MAEIVQVWEIRPPDVIERLNNIQNILMDASIRLMDRRYGRQHRIKRFLQLKLHPFHFPEHIRQLLTPLEIYVYEAAVNKHLIKAVKHDRLLDVNALQESLDSVQIVQEVAFLGGVVIGRGDREDENMERNIIHRDHMRLLGRICDCYEDPIDIKRLPESPNLYAPKEKRFIWNEWRENHVMEWVKQFIFNQHHLNLIECSKFDGDRLLEFLDSDDDWKTANYPFGVFIQLKSHMNRVVNARNGF